MPAGSFGAVGKNVEFLISSLNRKLNTTLPTIKTNYQEIAMVDREGQALTEYYPMEVSASREIDRGPTEDRQFSSAEVMNFTCDATRIDPENGKLIPVGDLYDPYKIVQQQAPDSIRQVSKIWDRRLARLINNNGLAYDGVPFWGTHSSNPGKVGAATFTNDIAVSGTDETSVKTIIDTMMQIPGYDGTLINEDLEMPIFLCPNMQIKIGLDKLFNAGLIAEQVVGGAASSNTRLMGWGQTVLMPELIAEAKPGADRAAAAKRFYVINNKYGNRRAFILRVLREPQFYISSGSDHFFHTKNARVFYYLAYGGANYALPQLALRCTLP